MSNPQPQRRRGARDLPLPSGETIATFDSYASAQKAVAALSRADFPVKSISIVGDELKSVERVTGKVSYGRAAIAGSVSGAWIGLFLGLMLVIINPESNLSFVVAAILMGAAFGMLFMVVSFSLSKRRTDVTSVMQIVASRYSVIVPGDSAEKARSVLDKSTD